VPRFLRDFAKGGGFLEGDVFIPPPVGAAIPTEQTVALPAGSKRQVAPAARRPVLRPPFLELATDGEVAEYPLKTTVAIGRSQDNDVVIDDIEVSRRHALLSWADGEATIRDLNSANGTTVNGQSISTNRPLRNGDVIGLGTTSLTYYNDFELARPRLASVSNGADQEHLIGRTLGIGRALSNDVVIADPTASRRHAQVALYDGQALVHDLDSANGTMVNGQRIVGDRELHDGDTITIGRTSLIYHNDLEARVPSRA
jgi:pSer/pThr/pTyr-binding forkhead associated (FHA) protein